MKIPYQALRLFSLAFIFNHMDMAGQNTKEAAAEIQLRETAANIYPWLVGGKIVGGLLPSSVFKSRHLSFFDPEDEKSMLLLQGDVPLMGELLSNSLGKGKSIDLEFLSKHVGYFFESTMTSGGSRILDQNYLRNYRSIIANKSAEKLGGDVATLELLEKENLCEGVVAKIENNHWRLTLNVIGPRGGIQHWDIRGTLQPFSLNQLNTQILHQNGSVHPLR